MNPNFISTKAISLSIAGLAFALGTSVRAELIVETFDGPLNPVMWDLTTGGNGWQVSDGKLKITRTTANSGRLVFAPQLIGNFDVQFDYELFWANTFAGGDRIHLGLSTDAPVHSYIVGHTQEGNIHGVAVDPGARYGWGPNAPSGKMRVTRSGTDVFMQYWNAGSWVTLQTGADNRDMWVSIDNYIFNGFTSGSRVEIDNFSISADRFSVVPEPGSFAILLGGLGLMIRSRRRYQS